MHPTPRSPGSNLVAGDIWGAGHGICAPLFTIEHLNSYLPLTLDGLCDLVEIPKILIMLETKA